jgi:hypothetical protein
VGLRHKMNHCTLNLNGLFIPINIIENEKETPLETSKYEPIKCKVCIFFLSRECTIIIFTRTRITNHLKT